MEVLMNRGTTADIVIVGAGVAGLAAAERLQRHGVEVLVVDKGRRPGGRLATRARGVTSFDHGAQYFTARDPAFAAFVDSLRDRGIVAPWAGRLVTIDGGTVMSREDGETRWVGVPEMNALAAAMAADESVIRGARVTDLLRDDGRWRVQLDDGAIVVANAAVVTPPPEQTAALLGTAAPELAAAAAAVPMAPCWAAMATFEAPVEVAFDGAFVRSGPLSWVARNSSKPGRPATECWVLHGSPEWSTAHLEDDPDKAADALLAAFRDLAPEIGSGAEPCGLQVHRWRYALPPEPAAERCLADPERRLVAAGDWCGGPRVEGAWLSGRAAAEKVLSWR
jgi:renalase